MVIGRECLAQAQFAHHHKADAIGKRPVLARMLTEPNAGSAWARGPTYSGRLALTEQGLMPLENGSARIAKVIKSLVVISGGARRVGCIAARHKNHHPLSRTRNRTR